MKKVIIFAFLICATVGYSQDWSIVNGINYNPVLSSGNPEQTNHKFFKVNPYDNSLWTIAPGKIIRIDQSTGGFDKFDYTNCPLFDDQMSFLDLAFTSQKVFTVSKFDGIYSYDGSSWMLEASYDQGTFLSTDHDTVWLARINEDFIKIADGSWSTNSGPYFRRICSKDGFMWACPSRESGTLVNYTNEIFHLFNADTIDFLSDNKNYDFKFSPNNNLLSS